VLIRLVRLLAQQAARGTEQQPKPISPSHLIVRRSRDDRRQQKYLRAADVARLMRRPGPSWRWIQPKGRPLYQAPVAPGLWQGRTLNACFAHLLEESDHGE
jgi:hypothetical protein